VLKLPPAQLEPLMRDTIKAEGYLRRELADRHQLAWFAPLGFNNTFALMVRGDDPQFADVRTLTDLREFLQR
jgi:osmoprotectant transport system permease protein